MGWTAPANLFLTPWTGRLEYRPYSGSPGVPLQAEFQARVVLPVASTDLIVRRDSVWPLTLPEPEPGDRYYALLHAFHEPYPGSESNLDECVIVDEFLREGESVVGFHVHRGQLGFAPLDIPRYDPAAREAEFVAQLNFAIPWSQVESMLCGALRFAPARS
jgi:hypothetical protein